MSASSAAELEATYFTTMASIFTALRRARRDGETLPSKSWHRAVETLLSNWHYGFTAFGGPPVHFQIFHKDFVDRRKWITEQSYQELFAICQALPGPGSTKMLYCINSVHNGHLYGLLAFLIWSLPGALGMYGLALGISHVGDRLPDPVYALISGLNAATVGIIALAAVQLAHNAITDKLSRLLVVFGGIAGMLYTALWYFPVLMAGAGIFTLLWDYRVFHRLLRRLTPKRKDKQPSQAEEVDMEDLQRSRSDDVQVVASSEDTPAIMRSGKHAAEVEEVRTPEQEEKKTQRWVIGRTGAISAALFLISFIVIMVLRGTLPHRPRGFSLFANLFLAGTIIFGGGPVVIPLLREYVVVEGWVSSRDFLLGLAIIQAFPGPNFNFAVYLGALTLATSPGNAFIGAVIGFLGIFVPGLFTATASMGLWQLLRSKKWLKSALRGIHSAAVGLVFTAVYKLWQIGLVIDGPDPGGNASLGGAATFGRPLGGDPWWVAITATSFAGGAWFGLSAPFAILLGGAMGMIWYAIVKV